MTRSEIASFIAAIGLGVPLHYWMFSGSRERPFTWWLTLVLCLSSLFTYPVLYTVGWNACFTSEYCTTMVRARQAEYDAAIERERFEKLRREPPT